jgi:signal transduction histidine kinase
MRRFDSPYLADWFAISLRWILLIGVVVSLGLGGQLAITSAWPLGIIILWNLVMTALASLNARMTYHRRIGLGVDLLLSSGFFWIGGGLDGSAFWIGLLPVFTGAIYYEVWGALLAAALSSALIIFYTFSQSPRSDSGLAIVFCLGLIAFSLLFGFLARQLLARMRQNRDVWLDTEDKKRRIQNERLRAIYELTSTLAATLSYKRVLDSALDMGASALNPDPDEGVTDYLVGTVLLFKGGVLRIGSARRFTNADMRVTFQASEGILKKVFDEGEPVLSNDIGYDPELGRVIALRNCTTAYCFPLRSGFNIYGALLFAHPDANYFNSERQDLLDIIGRQAVIAIQNARLYQDLVEEKERMVEVHEEARKKLARDLHDGPTQSVSAMAMRINLARRMLAKNTDGAADELAKIEELALRTTKEIRHMLFTLRPLVLESQGLEAALKAMAEKMRETFSQEVKVAVDERVASQLEMGKQGVIFYIVEEATNNARKHASATTIAVTLRQFEPNVGLLEIADNGVGFDVGAVNKAYDKRGSLGMVNLRERAELVNGLLHIDSAPGKGTRVQVYIPLTEEAADRLHHGRK